MHSTYHRMLARVLPPRYRGAEYSDEPVCMFLCVSACICQEPHVQTWSNFRCIFPVAVPRSSSGGVAISYVLPVFFG